jgi:hypothetical protein
MDEVFAPLAFHVLPRSHALWKEGTLSVYRFSLHRFASKPASYVMSLTEAEALADRIRTDIRSGAIQLAEPVPIARSANYSNDLTLQDVATRYRNEYARTETRRPHAIRQFEIYIDLLQSAKVPGPRNALVALGQKVFTSVQRPDLDAAFAARLAAVEAARRRPIR